MLRIKKRLKRHVQCMKYRATDLEKNSHRASLRASLDITRE